MKFGAFKRETAPFVFTPEMAFVMGGEKSATFKWHTQLCCRAYNILRKHANIFLTLFAMVRILCLHSPLTLPISTLLLSSLFSVLLLSSLSSLLSLLSLRSPLSVLLFTFWSDTHCFSSCTTPTTDALHRYPTTEKFWRHLLPTKRFFPQQNRWRGSTTLWHANYGKFELQAHTCQQCHSHFGTPGLTLLLFGETMLSLVFFACRNFFYLLLCVCYEEITKSEMVVCFLLLPSVLPSGPLFEQRPVHSTTFSRIFPLQSQLVKILKNQSFLLRVFPIIFLLSQQNPTTVHLLLLQPAVVSFVCCPSQC